MSRSIRNETLDVSAYISSLSPYSVPILSSKDIHDVFDGAMCDYPITIGKDLR
jgi:hypothetical protein